MVLKELGAVDAYNINCRIIDRDVHGLGLLVGLGLAYHALLRDGDGCVDAELLPCKRTENLCEISNADFSACRIEEFLVGRSVAHLDGDRQACLGCENYDVGDAFEKDAARRK